MDIQEYIDIARTKPDSLQIIGKGGRCLALVSSAAPNQVLLLESGKETADGVVRTDPSHDRAVTFARQYDGHLSTGLGGVVNNDGVPYVHSDLISGVSPKKFGEPLYLHIGKGKVFAASSARLVKRIPGQALHYLDFVDPKSPVGRAEQAAIATDIAQWLFQLHHQVSPGAMVANKIEKQFRDIGRTVASRTLNSEKHTLFVVENAREVQKLEEKLNASTENMTPIQRRNVAQLRDNIEAAGVNFPLLARTTKALESFLRETLPTDRVGLTHSDLHPANILTSRDRKSVTGVCDWMTGCIDAQSIDFAGLGLARGLLPKVVREYRNLEQRNKIAKPINYQTVYAYAAMRQIFITVKALKNGFDDGVAARVAYEQVGESVEQLGRMNPKFRQFARKFRHETLPPIRLPAERSGLGSRPHKVTRAPA